MKQNSKTVIIARNRDLNAAHEWAKEMCKSFLYVMPDYLTNNTEVTTNSHTSGMERMRIGGDGLLHFATDYRFHFMDEIDAMAFKLKWA